jgi:glycosyltransferase involved in cell wall biosynthesis
MKIFLVGKIPPPIGGVTMHTKRLGYWLSKINGLSVTYIFPKFFSLIAFFGKMLLLRRKSSVVHCQISSVWGALVIVFILRLSRSRAKFVYSLHSEFWIPDNTAKNTLLGWGGRHILASASLIIADNKNIQEAALVYAPYVCVQSPFLPPPGELLSQSLSSYLELPELDVPVIVFNAYRLVYRPDGRDVYGLDVLLDAFGKINFDAALILLIPVLNDDDLSKIASTLTSMSGNLNKDRIHLVSRVDIEGWQVIAKADVFVRPTITDGDALSVRESIYYGVPAVVSDCTARPPGVITFKTGDADDLAEKIKVAIRRGKEKSTINTTKNPAHEFFLQYSNLF